MAKSVPLHVHSNLVTALFTFIEFLLIWIPAKMLAAHYENRSALASAVLKVL